MIRDILPTMQTSRREAIELVLIAAQDPPAVHREKENSMKITCLIRYQIDPFQRNEFKTYAENWGRIIPRCGGDLIG